MPRCNWKEQRGRCLAANGQRAMPLRTEGAAGVASLRMEQRAVPLRTEGAADSAAEVGARVLHVGLGSAGDHVEALHGVSPAEDVGQQARPGDVDVVVVVDGR